MCHGRSLRFLPNYGWRQTTRPKRVVALFYFDLCTSGLDLFLDLVRLLLCHAFLDCLRGTFDKRLCFRQAKSRHRTANLLDHSNLVRAHLFQYQVKGALLSCRWSCRSASCPPCSRTSRHRSCCADTPLFFQLLDQPSNLQHRQVAEFLHQFFFFCHFYLPPIAASESFRKIKANSHWPGQFSFHFPTRHCGRKNYLTPSLARSRPPFLPSRSIAAPMRSPVRSVSAPSALRETRTVLAIAPAKRREVAGPQAFPILQRKE